MRSLAYLLSLIIICAGCGSEDDNGRLELTFKGMYDGEPLVMLQPYSYADGMQIKFNQSDFFVSDIQLVDADNRTVMIQDLALVDITNSHTSTTTANNGFKLVINDVPARSYKSLTMSIGVPSDMNARLPSDFDADHPLSNTGYYWSAWNSFIFSKTEGTMDTLGTDNFNLSFLFHTGTNELFRTASLEENFEVGADATTSFRIEMDHKALFQMDSGFFDIRGSAVNHDPTNIIPLRVIMDNFERNVFSKAD